MGVVQGLLANGGYLYAAWKVARRRPHFLLALEWQRKMGPAGTIGGNTSAGPSLGVFGGSLCAAWKGEWSDPRLFFAKYNGSDWEAQVQIPNVVQRRRARALRVRQ